MVGGDFTGAYSVTFEADWPALRAAVYQFGHLSTGQSLGSESDGAESSVNGCQSLRSSSVSHTAAAADADDDDAQVMLLSLLIPLSTSLLFLQSARFSLFCKWFVSLVPVLSLMWWHCTSQLMSRSALQSRTCQLVGMS